MASLAGAITTLGLAGVPFGGPVWNSEYLTEPRPYTVTFTQLGLDGSSVVRHTDYTKIELTDVQHVVSDTASVSATEGPIDSQIITTHDAASLAVTDTASLFNFLNITDSISLSVSESVGLIISGVTEKPVTETASLSVSETVALSVTVEVTDTASISVTDSGTVDVDSENVTASDDAAVSVSEEVLLGIFAGINVVNVGDVATLTAVEAALVRESFFSDRTPRSRTVFVNDRRRH
jgi:hypothetical protein